MAILIIMLLFISLGMSQAIFEDYKSVSHLETIPVSNKATLTIPEFNLTYTSQSPTYNYEAEDNLYNITYAWKNPFSFSVYTLIERSRFYVNATYINDVELRDNYENFTIKQNETVTIFYCGVPQWYILDYLCGNPNRWTTNETTIKNAIEKTTFAFTFPSSEWQRVFAKYPNSFQTKTITVYEQVSLGTSFHFSVFPEYLKDGLIYSVIVIAVIWLSAFLYFQIKGFKNWLRAE